MTKIDLLAREEGAAAASPLLTLTSKLYLGRSRPNGYGQVSHVELDAWVAEELAPRFPDGWTLIHAEGGWRDYAKGETIREHSVIVELAHAEEDAAKVHALARSYKERFGQDAVMVSTSVASVAFV